MNRPLGLLQSFPFQGHCMEAGAWTGQPPHLPCPFNSAAPGPLLSLCLGASPTEGPAVSSAGPMAKPRAAGGLLRGTVKRSPTHRVGENAGQKPDLQPRAWEVVGQDLFQPDL